MTPTKNPALEWRLDAIDRLDVQQRKKLIGKMACLGINLRSQTPDRLKVLVTRMTEVLETLDAIGGRPG